MPPSRELMRQFQRSRIVFVTGERDEWNLTMDANSRQSMHRWCVFDVDAHVTPRAVHETANAVAFAGALRSLLSTSPPSADKLTACNGGIEKKVDEKLQRVAALIEGGKREEAQKLLSDTDRHFGGVAALRSVELQSLLGCKLPAGH